MTTSNEDKKESTINMVDIDKSERNKVSAEVEFFMLCAIALRSNLVEEHPARPEILNEDITSLFGKAQNENIEMSKFNLWIEHQLRTKYNLPKNKSWNKFNEKQNIQQKMKNRTSKKQPITKNKIKKQSQSIQSVGNRFTSRIRNYAKTNGAKTRIKPQDDIQKSKDEINRDLIEELRIEIEKSNIRAKKLEHDDIRNNNLQEKKNWLTLLTVVISVFSFVGSLFLSQVFGVNHKLNGIISISASFMSFIFGCIKFYISYNSYISHKTNNDGLKPDSIDTFKKDWIGYIVLMKAISMSIATINDASFDFFQGIAAILNENYTASLLLMLQCTTWFGVGEEGFELIVEIFFTSNDFECCSSIYYNTAFLIWSVTESVIGIYLLNAYHTEELKIIGIFCECLILISAFYAFGVFMHWNNTKNPSKLVYAKDDENQ
eukprot:448502_1